MTQSLRYLRTSARTAASYIHPASDHPTPSSSNSNSISAFTKLQHRTILRNRNKVRIQLELIVPLPSHAHPHAPLPRPPLHPLRNPKLQAEHNVRDGKQQLRHRHIAGSTHAGANEERRKRAGSLVDRALRVVGARDPALRREAERPRECRAAVVQRIHARADCRARRHCLPVDHRAAGPHHTPRRCAQRRAEPQRFADARAQVRAGAQGWAGDDGGGAGERGADFGRQLSVGVEVA